MVAKKSSNNVSHSHGNKHRSVSNSASSEHSVEAYKNPTDLFQWINFGRWNKAIKRTRNCPSEACIWIFSVDESSGKKKWKYLPIHMVCLQPNPPLSMVEALIEAYPRGARCRDLDGNLALHYLCLEACTDKQVLDCVINAYEVGLNEKDKYGRTACQIMEFELERRKIEPALRDSVLQYLSWKSSHQRDSRNDEEIVRQHDAPASGGREFSFLPNNNNNNSNNSKVKFTSKSNKDSSQHQQYKAQEQLTDVLHERNALRDQVDSVLKESRSSRKLIASLRHQMDKMHNSNDQLLVNHKEALQLLQTDLSKHKTENSALAAQLDSTKTILQDEQAKLSSAVTDNASIKLSIQALTEENFQCLQKLDQHKVVDMELTSLREQLQKLKQETLHVNEHRDAIHGTAQLGQQQEEHNIKIDEQKRLYQTRMDDQKQAFQVKIEAHKTTLQNKFEELKTAYQKKLDDQKASQLLKTDDIKCLYDQQVTTLKDHLDTMKLNYVKNVEELKVDHGNKIDQLTAQMWKTEENKTEKERKIEDMKRLYQRKLDELRLDHKRLLDDQKSSFQQKHLNHNNEYRKVNDEMQFTTKELESKYRKVNDDMLLSTKELEAIRNEKLQLTEENFSLRRTIDEQEIEFDKKLMNVRKAVALQADAFANLQNHFSSNNNQNMSMNMMPQDDSSIILQSTPSMGTAVSNQDYNNLNTLDSYFADNNASDIETARTKVITLTTEKHALELELLKFKKKNNIIANENISFTQQYELLSANYKDLQTSLVQAKDNENALTKQTDDKSRFLISQRDDLQAEVDLLKSKNKKLREDIDNLEDNSDKQKKERERAIQELTDKITTSQNKIAELRDMVTKNKTSYQEKLDTLTASYDILKQDHTILQNNAQKHDGLDILLNQEQNDKKLLKQENATLEQKLDELQCIANGLQNDNEDLIEKQQQQMKSSSFGARRSANTLKDFFDNHNHEDTIEHLKMKLKDIMYENEQHKETIIQQQDSIRSLQDKITSYQKKIKILAMDKSVGRQRIIDEITDKITSLASSLLHLSNLQNRIVQSSVQTEKLYQRAAIEERELLLETITGQEKEYGTSRIKRDRLPRDDSMDRESILKEIYKMEEERKVVIAKDRESILKAVLKLQYEIELVSGDIAML